MALNKPLAAMLLTISWSTWLLQQPSVLDLTKPLPMVADPLGMPNGTGIRQAFRGRDVPEIVPGYALPLTLELRSTELSRVPNGPFTIEVSITNSGSAPFFLPVSTDPKRASMLPGNKGRRLLQFGVRFQSPGQSDVQIIGRTTEGSQTGKDSLLELEPRGSVRVRFVAYPTPEAQALAKNSSTATVRAILIEQSFEDSRWYLEETSSATVSVNALPISQ